MLQRGEETQENTHTDYRRWPELTLPSPTRGGTATLSLRRSSTHALLYVIVKQSSRTVADQHRDPDRHSVTDFVAEESFRLQAEEQSYWLQVMCTLCSCAHARAAVRRRSSPLPTDGREVFRAGGRYGALALVKLTRLWGSNVFGGTGRITKCKCAVNLLNIHKNVKRLRCGLRSNFLPF